MTGLVLVVFQMDGESRLSHNASDQSVFNNLSREACNENARANLYVTLRVNLIVTGSSMLKKSDVLFRAVMQLERCS